MKVLKINSYWAEDGFYIPAEANMKYLMEKDLEKTQEVIINSLLDKNWLKKDDVITIEEFEFPSEEFDCNLFLEPNLKLLCFLGFSYPRYFNGKEIHYGSWYLYEFGRWGKNENHYYNEIGEYLETEIVE